MGWCNFVSLGKICACLFIPNWTQNHVTTYTNIYTLLHHLYGIIGHLEAKPSIFLILLDRGSWQLNLTQPFKRNVTTASVPMSKSSHYAVIGALVGTLTGIGLVINKQKVD